MLIGPRLTVKWLLSIRNLKVQKYSPVLCVRAAVCVHPRLCKTSQRHTSGSGQVPREIPDLSRDSLCSNLLFFSTLKEVGLGLSPTTPAVIAAHKSAAVFPPLFAPSPFRRTVRSAGFPCIYPASALHSQAAFPGLDLLRTGWLRFRQGGGWCSRRPLLPLGLGRAARWARVRARAGLLGKSSLEAADRR